MPYTLGPCELRCVSVPSPPPPSSHPTSHIQMNAQYLRPTRLVILYTSMDLQSRFYNISSGSRATFWAGWLHRADDRSAERQPWFVCCLLSICCPSAMDSFLFVRPDRLLPTCPAVGWIARTQTDERGCRVTHFPLSMNQSSRPGLSGLHRQATSRLACGALSEARGWCWLLAEQVSAADHS